MGFAGLLGNDRLKENLITSLRSGRHAHFYLICGPEGSGRRTLAQLLAAALLCQQSGKPCLQCPSCRKVLHHLHPDVITVTDPDHKYIPVDQIRQVREDLFIRPNEGSKKIYILPQALRTEGQNALLKVLEEPPEYGVFLLLTDNPEKLLSTVRSRCTELKMLPLNAETLHHALQQEFPDADAQAIAGAISRSGGYLGQAKALLENGQAVLPQTEQLVEAFCSRDNLRLTQTLVPMEKWGRDALQEALQQWLEILEDALCCRSGGKALSPLSAKLATARSAWDLRSAIEKLQKSIEYAQGNVSCGAICGWLAWALR